MICRGAEAIFEVEKGLWNARWQQTYLIPGKFQLAQFTKNNGLTEAHFMATLFNVSKESALTEAGNSLLMSSIFNREYCLSELLNSTLL